MNDDVKGLHKEVRRMMRNVSAEDASSKLDTRIITHKVRTAWMRKESAERELETLLIQALERNRYLEKLTDNIGKIAFAVGKEIVKKNGRPFREQQRSVVATGVVEHPHTNGLAYTYTVNGRDLCIDVNQCLLNPSYLREALRALYE